jgi:hypothetical protein
MRMRRQLIAAVAVGVVLACVTVSLRDGRPRGLPGVALASAVMLHAERTLALLAVTMAAVSIVMHACADGCRSSYPRAGCATRRKRPMPRPRRWQGCRTSSMTWWRSSSRSPSDSTHPVPVAIFESLAERLHAPRPQP